MGEYQKSLDCGLSPVEQFALQTFTRDYQKGVLLGIDDLQHHKRLYDTAMFKRSANDVRSFWFVLDSQPNYACTGGIFPEVDFHGVTPQDLAQSSPLDMVFFSVLPGDGKGLVVFSWLDPAPASAALVDSLLTLTSADLPHAITRFAFEFYENILVSPDWWANLPDVEKQRLADRAESSTPDVLRLPDCLLDDGKRIVTWNITATHDFR